ncbi:MAG: hypothetical protein N2Z72_03445 [Bacteroidales bacterium]|nr:hypothetical protein [Bacteroidales bacterium]
MKKISIFLILWYLGKFFALCQNVGIGDLIFVPDPSALLELRSTSKGLLIPRVSLQSTTDIITVPTPAEGLLIYNIATINNVTPGFYYWNGTEWVRFNTGTGGVSNPAWELAGNAGTNPAQHYVGTSDLKGLNIATNATPRIMISDSGNIRFLGRFVNQFGTKVGIPCTTNVSNPAPGGWVSAPTLNLPTNVGGVTTRENSQSLVDYNDVNRACVIHGTTKSIVLTDSLQREKAVLLILGNVSIRTLNAASLPNALRFHIWLQRSNDNFSTQIQNVWKTESAIAAGNVLGSDNVGTGNITVPILYLEDNLPPGTYTYRLVFQGGNYGTGGGIVNFEALDRTLIILKIKQ